MTRIGQAGGGIPQLVEEGMHHSIDGRKPLGRGVLQEFRDEVDRIRVGLPEHL